MTDTYRAVCTDQPDTTQHFGTAEERDAWVAQHRAETGAECETADPE